MAIPEPGPRVGPASTNPPRLTNTSQPSVDTHDESGGGRGRPRRRGVQFRRMAKAPFSPDAIGFLRDLRANNSREWFQPRKDAFTELLQKPMLAVCEAVLGQLRTFAVDHVVPPAKAVKRIYRDVRFSKDKTPYKTGTSAMFPRAGLGKDGGAIFYFGVSPDGVRVAAGLYAPGPPELAAVRAEIDRSPAAFGRVTSAAPLLKAFGPLQGEQLVRTPKGFPPDHPAGDLLRRKQFYFSTLLDVAEATRGTLPKVIVDRFRAVAPFVEYVNQLILVADRAATAGEDDGRPKRPDPMF